MTWSHDHRAALSAAARVAAAAEPGVDLAEVLYREWYAAPVGPVEQLDPWSAPLAGLLRAAHACAREWTEPRVVAGHGLAGTLVVDSPRRALCRGDYRTVEGSAGLVPSRGSRVATLMRQGGQVADGWWRTWGGDWAGEAAIAAGVTRIYFATIAPEVARLTHAVTRAVGAVTGEWAFKVGVDPRTLARADGAVLYVPDQRVGEVAVGVAVAARPFVRPGRPPLTAALVPGVSRAQDPGDGRSFGESRCAVVAQAYAEWLDVGGEFADVVADAFGRAGLDAARPEMRAQAVSA